MNEWTGEILAANRQDDMTCVGKKMYKDAARGGSGGNKMGSVRQCEWTIDGMIKVYSDFCVENLA